MKILIVTQRYYPESFRINDIAETLVKEGNDVTVLTGLPMYPKGYIFNEYKKGKNRNQIHNGVKIIRSKEIERKNNIFSRFLNYNTFPKFANSVVKKLDDDFDVVFVNQLSPIMSALPALQYKKLHNTKVVMYGMDLWPESLLAGGIKKDSIIYNHYKKVSSKIYLQCDKILVSTKEHINYIKSLPNCANLDIEYLPQYAEEIFEKIEPRKIDATKPINLMFAGNVGKAEAVENIIKAANILNDNNKFKFSIVGGGSDLKNVKKLAEDLHTNNVTFYDQKDINEMPKVYNNADVMLVSFEDHSYANLTIPGKVQSYMAAGKPIIGCLNGATANLIADNAIGEVVGAGDYKGLAQLIQLIDPYIYNEYAKNSKDVYNELFSKKNFINKLIENLKKYSK